MQLDSVGDSMNDGVLSLEVLDAKSVVRTEVLLMCMNLRFLRIRSRS